MSSDRALRLARLAFFVAAVAFVACLVVQLFLVGLDLFEVTGEEDGVHREFAYIYGWIAPLLVLLAVAARLPRPRLLQAVALLVLFAVQTYLPSLADRAPLLAAVHAVNALAVLWVAVSLAVGGREAVLPLADAGGP